MARQYSKGAAREVERAMKKRKTGTLKSGRSGKKVKSRKQAIAIGLSKARSEGKKVPKKKTSRTGATKKSALKKTARKAPASRKAPSSRKTAKKTTRKAVTTARAARPGPRRVKRQMRRANSRS